MYKNTFHFSLLPPSSLQIELSVFVYTNYKSRKNCFCLKINRSHLFFVFYNPGRISSHLSRMIDLTAVDARFIRKRSKRNFTSCLSFHPCLPFSSFLSSYSFRLPFPSPLFFLLHILSFSHKREISRGSRIKRDNWKIVIQLFTGCCLNLDLNSRLNECNSLWKLLVVPYKNFYRSSE